MCCCLFLFVCDCWLLFVDRCLLGVLGCSSWLFLVVVVGCSVLGVCCRFSLVGSVVCLFVVVGGFCSVWLRACCWLSLCVDCFCCLLVLLLVVVLVVVVDGYCCLF